MVQDLEFRVWGFRVEGFVVRGLGLRLVLRFRV